MYLCMARAAAAAAQNVDLGDCMGDAELKTFGENVRKVRFALGISQSELARRARLSQPRVSEIEAGVRGGLEMKTMARLAKAIGRSVHELLAPK